MFYTMLLQHLRPIFENLHIWNCVVQIQLIGGSHYGMAQKRGTESR